MPTDWRNYLLEYHGQHPAITEELLERAASESGASPYQDLLNQVPDGIIDVLDLACGSAPLAPQLQRGGIYVGVDQSTAELSRARAKLPRVGLVIGDALALPITESSVDTVVCSMGLMLLQPLPTAVSQIARVLKPGGRFVAMYPSNGLPLARELPYVAAIFAGLLTAPKYPQTLTRSALNDAFICNGMRVTKAQTRRYSIPVDTVEHAGQVIDGLYLPDVPQRRVQRARRLLRALARPNATVPLHLTHFTATKPVTPERFS